MALVLFSFVRDSPWLRFSNRVAASRTFRSASGRVCLCVSHAHFVRAACKRAAAAALIERGVRVRGAVLTEFKGALPAAARGWHASFQLQEEKKAAELELEERVEMGGSGHDHRRPTPRTRNGRTRSATETTAPTTTDRARPARRPTKPTPTTAHRCCPHQRAGSSARELPRTTPTGVFRPDGSARHSSTDTARAAHHHSARTRGTSREASSRRVILKLNETTEEAKRP